MTLGPAWNRGGTLEAALGHYRFSIDPGGLTGATALIEQRSGQQNDDVYALEIGRFLKTDSLRVISVRRNGTAIELEYEFRHPFPAPQDPTAPPNGFANRADLGIAGLICFAVDVPTATGNTYFTDVVVNTGTLVKVDGFVRPAGLIATGTSTNTFPYLALVDENNDGSRVGIPTGADPTGNYGDDGWTRDEFGATHDGWTGYGVLHQGQASRRLLEIDTDTITPGPVVLNAFVLAKYNDPRGGANAPEKRGNRLPPATPDASLFAYRMPHGALDCESVSFGGDANQFLVDDASSSTLTFHVIDWDARATETTAADLSDDPIVTAVTVGETGLPALAVCIPGVLGDATAVDLWDPATTVLDNDGPWGGDPEVDSGRPADALCFQKLVAKPAATGQSAGSYTGLVRVTDPEVDHPPPTIVCLNGATLAPLTVDIPRPEVFQVFSVRLNSTGCNPSVQLLGPDVPVPSGNGLLSLTVVNFTDCPPDPLQIQFDWNADSDFLDTGEGLQTLTGPQSFDSPIFYNNPSITPSNRTLPWRASEVVAAPLTGDVVWILGGNQPPEFIPGTTDALASTNIPSGSFFTMNAGTVNPPITVSDAEGDPLTYKIYDDLTPATPKVVAATFPINGIGPYSLPTTLVTFTTYVCDPVHPDKATANAFTPPLTGTIGTVTTTGWARSFPSSGKAPEVHGLAVAVDSAGNSYVTGYFAWDVNFGGGTRSAPDGYQTQVFLVKYNAAGDWQWDKEYGDTDPQQGSAITIDQAGDILLAGSFAATINFG
ncbi:MAG: hypothetical protein ABI743_06640, partial [bacterium]